MTGCDFSALPLSRAFRRFLSTLLFFFHFFFSMHVCVCAGSLCIFIRAPTYNGYTNMHIIGKMFQSTYKDLLLHLLLSHFDLIVCFLLKESLTHSVQCVLVLHTFYLADNMHNAYSLYTMYIFDDYLLL